MSYAATVTRNHLSRDYSQSEFLRRLGLKNPKPVADGCELLVVCDCGTCVSMEEAMDSVDHLPTPDEIYEEARRIREATGPRGRRKEEGPMLPRIRIIESVHRTKRLPE